MKKINYVIWFVVIIIVGGLYFFNNKEVNLNKSQSYKNISYIIDDNPVLLIEGISEQSIPNSTSKITTRYFGNEAVGDFNDDGLDDIAFLLTQDGGGSGTFYYVAVASKTNNGYRGTNAILLGDRIAPQTTEFRDGKIIINYATREKNEPMTTQHSVGVSKYFKIVERELVEEY